MEETSVLDMSRGWAERGGAFRCLICGESFEQGVIYPIGGKQFEAFRAVAEHVRSTHGSVFRHLLQAQEKYLGLTPRQAELLSLMHEGLSDREISQQKYGAANTAAVRNLRFQLREREKQARAYLALMEAFRREKETDAFGREEKLEMSESATMADERFEITQAERGAVLRAYFAQDGSLKEFPVREKRKIIVLMEIAKRFEKGKVYSEKEVNLVIAFRDFALIRRYLVEYGFLTRKQDCSEYRVKED